MAASGGTDDFIDRDVHRGGLGGMRRLVGRRELCLKLALAAGLFLEAHSREPTSLSAVGTLAGGRSFGFPLPLDGRLLGSRLMAGVFSFQFGILALCTRWYLRAALRLLSASPFRPSQAAQKYCSESESRMSHSVQNGIDARHSARQRGTPPGKIGYGDFIDNCGRNIPPNHTRVRCGEFGWMPARECAGHIKWVIVMTSKNSSEKLERNHQAEHDDRYGGLCFGERDGADDDATNVGKEGYRQEHSAPRQDEKRNERGAPISSVALAMDAQMRPLRRTTKRLSDAQPIITNDYPRSGPRSGPYSKKSAIVCAMGKSSLNPSSDAVG